MARRFGRKPYITVTLPEELLQYLEDKVASRDFASMAHGIEVCILRFKEAEGRGERP
jgi:Arc/MetJ-type ribon-helix-helix transcriptional regulator